MVGVEFILSLRTTNSNTNLILPPSLVVSGIDLMGWGTAAVLCDWVLLSLHTQQQQQDCMTPCTSAELVHELEFRAIMRYLVHSLLAIEIFT